MLHLRKTAFFTLVALALTGCGAAAAVTLHPLDSSAAPTICAADTPIVSTCITQAEENLGETPLSGSTLTEQEIADAGFQFTSPPSTTASISVAQADSVAMEGDTLPSPAVRSTVLAELHDLNGDPAQGELVYLVDVTPPSGTLYQSEPVSFAFIVVDATTGTVVGSDIDTNSDASQSSAPATTTPIPSAPPSSIILPEATPSTGTAG